MPPSQLETLFQLRSDLPATSPSSNNVESITYTMGFEAACIFQQQANNPGKHNMTKGKISRMSRRNTVLPHAVQLLEVRRDHQNLAKMACDQGASVHVDFAWSCMEGPDNEHQSH